MLAVIALFAVLALPAHADLECAKVPADWKVLAARDYDWNRDGKLDRFILEVANIPNCGNFEAPGRLRILLSGQPPFQSLLEGVMESKMTGARNELDSEWLFMTRLSTRSAEPPVLFVHLDGFHSAPTLGFALVAGRPREAGYVYLRVLRDVDGDGATELLGDLTQDTESWGHGCTDYNPMLVHRFQGGKFALDLELSAKENEKQGYPWMGAKTFPIAEIVVVVDEKTSRPRLVRKADAKGTDARCFKD